MLDWSRLLCPKYLRHYNRRDMQRLEAKSINGRTYYYLSLWGWKNGKCRRLSQKYLGKPEDIAGLVAFLASSHGDYICAQSILLDGGRTVFR